MCDADRDGDAHRCPFLDRTAREPGEFSPSQKKPKGGFSNVRASFGQDIQTCTPDSPFFFRQDPYVILAEPTTARHERNPSGP